MLKVIKRYIKENIHFFIIVLLNLVVLYPIGQVYDIQSEALTLFLVRPLLYKYICVLNILMILKYKKIIKTKIVIIIFLLSLFFDCILYIDMMLVIIKSISDLLLGIVVFYILVKGDTKSNSDMHELIYIFIALLLLVLNVWGGYFYSISTYLEKNIVYIHLITMLLPYICMFPITVILLDGEKKELKAIIISLLITLLFSLILTLVDIKNVLIILALFSVLYLFIRDKSRIIKINIKSVMIYILLLTGVCGYKYLKSKDREWLKVDKYYEEGGRCYDENLGQEIEDEITDISDKKTYILYKRVRFKKRIFGEIIKGKREGRWIDWDENGRKRIEGVYINNKKEGKWIEYYENGKKESEGIYKKGKLKGKWMEWYENGERKKEGNYNENGKKEGKWIEYYENGKKESEGIYSDGNQIGKWIKYYEDGKKYAEITYKDDGEIERIVYDEEGNPIE